MFIRTQIGNEKINIIEINGLNEIENGGTSGGEFIGGNRGR